MCGYSQLPARPSLTQGAESELVRVEDLWREL